MASISLRAARNAIGAATRARPRAAHNIISVSSFMGKVCPPCGGQLGSEDFVGCRVDCDDRSSEGTNQIFIDFKTLFVPRRFAPEFGGFAFGNFELEQ